MIQAKNRETLNVFAVNIDSWAINITWAEMKILDGNNDVTKISNYNQSRLTSWKKHRLITCRNDQSFVCHLARNEIKSEMNDGLPI